ncbi:MAG: hypothetical protein NWE98_02590 [Candidatus Bathyarchaeota archaeon]|nr:hypothetical protein [Candidatus Bathyarchaeota archaeon]
MNNKGQFSIIAALLVAVVLVASVMTTYSAIRYNPSHGQPQILSAIDETNLGLKEMLGFTVGYYGSILKVTGNLSYAQQLATTYLKSGLTNLGQIRPEWGTTFNLNNLTLSADWFSNESFSQGFISINYNLTGLGISGISYATSTRLDVKISNASTPNQAQLTILRDGGEPLINLGRNNLKFYCYNFDLSNWVLTQPTGLASYANGTYIVDLPLTLISSSYVIQVEDTRGLMVLASSFSQISTTLTWNSSTFTDDLYFVENSNPVIGTQSSFAAQQQGPDGTYDTLTEQSTGTVIVDNYPKSFTPLGLTTNVSGSVADLQTDNGAYLHLRSHGVYNSINFDSQNSSVLASAANSISWTHTTGAGNDRILLVAIDVFSSSGQTTTVSGVTYGGTALTLIGTDLYNTNPRVRSYVYYLLNPSTGTKTITATFASSTTAAGGSITYSNVNQTTPYTAASTNSNSSNNASVSLTASGTYSKVLFGHVGTYRTSSYSVTDGQTNRWSQTGQQYKSFGSEKIVTSGAVSMSWTASSTASWVAIAVLLQPTMVPNTYLCEAEFMGTSNTETWNNIIWTLDAGASVNGVDVTYQLFNYRTGEYVNVGNGYLTDTLGTSDTTKTQTITSGLTDYRDEWGNWKIKVNATNTIPFDVKLDLINYSINQINYALNVEERWSNINTTNPRQVLCIKTGNTASSESLVLQILYGGFWRNLTTLVPNYFNNVSLGQYIDSSTLTIRFVGGNDAADSTQDSWRIDSVYIKDEPDINYLVNLQQSTFTLEILQNGTMRWLGQNIQLSGQTLPIPPVPVKSIHVNQTIGGISQEVPFQIEDWASNYQIPLGLTSNATVFGNRQMIVFLLNSRVTDFTIWWDGSDNAIQTPLAYTNRYFTGDNTDTSTLTNGNITLQFGSFNVKSTVAGTNTSSTATFMRINQEASTYGAGLAYVIHHGIIRDIVQQEAEWGTGGTGIGGADGCPNIYANIIITLPANATYYTYQLRLMFINSTQQRTITDICPIQLATSLFSVQAQTENGTAAGSPLIQNGTGVFANYSAGSWTPHHWTQFIAEGNKGTGIMFTDLDNRYLFTFDALAGSSTGALNVNATSRVSQLLPVTLATVRFTYAYDITWRGAVATFDNTTPICNLYQGATPMGLWILVEYPPTLTVTAKS